MSDPDMFQFMLNLALYLFHTAEIAYHDMGSQCCFGSAQCPDMQMVITLHTGLLQDNPPDLFTIPPGLRRAKGGGCRAVSSRLK